MRSSTFRILMRNMLHKKLIGESIGENIIHIGGNKRTISTSLLRRMTDMEIIITRNKGIRLNSIGAAMGIVELGERAVGEEIEMDEDGIIDFDLEDGT